MPLVSSLRGYRRAWLAADLVAAITLLVIAIPEQLATSRLAGMPPVTGWYAFVAGTVMFALLGSSSQLSVGADSTIAPLFAVGIAHLASNGSPRYDELVAILAVSVGVIVALVWLLRLGWIAEFLSAPIITGFLAGIAVLITVHQLPDLFGVQGAGGSTVHRIATTLKHLGHTSGWTVGIAAAVFAIAFGAQRINRRIPGALIGLVGAGLAVALFHLDARGVGVVGALAVPAPHFALPAVQGIAELSRLVPLALVVAMVCIMQTSAVASTFPSDDDKPDDVSRDF
ncbi:MAG TPA: SulP family inorganic anion transporter, partial [Solirubrobacteraceae bacterium]|nr:SulP family inorganic anion transporter [Solirubrobacteraceae bacterium]